jgi:hypothetical protein
MKAARNRGLVLDRPAPLLIPWPMGAVLRPLSLLLAALLPGPAAAQEEAGTRWFSITAERGTLGHATQRSVDRAGGRESVETREIRLRERESRLSVLRSRTVTRQDDAGRIVSIVDEQRHGASLVRTEARILPGRVEVVRETPAGRHAESVALPPDVRFDSGGGLLAAWDPAARPRLEFLNFNLGAMVVERVVLSVAPPAPGDPPGGLAVLRARYEGHELRGLSRLVLDRGRRVVATTQPMFGLAITTRSTDRATALRRHPPFRLLSQVLVRSPYRISDSALLQGRMRYTFSFQGGLEFPVPQTAEQRVRAGPGTVTLDICRTCGPGLPTDAAYLADARRPTLWLQSDAPALRAIAEPVARMAISDARKMEELRERGRPYLARIDFAGHYSALETLHRHAGDCTEAAVLLAALGRAAGIPTRVVNGLVYTRERYHGVANAFMPHSWVLAYVDGHWQSFDLALDRFDTSHIALTVGDGDARSVQAAIQLAGLLRWDQMTEIRRRPPT